MWQYLAKGTMEKNTHLMCFLVGSNMGLSHPPHFPWSKLGPVINFLGAGHQSSHADDDADADCKDSY
jgi:hypothetical protein